MISNNKQQKIRKRIKRKYTLPNAKVSLEKELEIIRGLVEFSDNGAKAISYKDIKIGIHETKISRELPFLESIHLATIKERGKYMPTEECIEFVKHFKWDEERAKVYLKKILSNTWFVELTRKILKVKHNIKIDGLIKELGKECNADPSKDIRALKRLVEWMKWANIIKEEEGKIFLVETMPSEEEEAEGIVPPPTMLAVKKLPSSFAIQLVVQVTKDTTKEDLIKIIKTIKEALKEVSELEE